MPTLQEKIYFAEHFITNKEGVNFSIKGRDWVRNNFWLPADGFKLWRHEDREPCDKCKDNIGEIIEHPDDNETIDCECGGLDARPIIVTILNLQRQDGKTFSSMAYALSTLNISKNKSFALIGASEDQALALYRENYEEAINRNSKLKKRCNVQRMRFTIPKTNGIFEAMSTAHKSATGRSRTHLLIDEARDIEARVVMALIPSVFAMHGVECPRGHIQLDSEQSISIPKTCTACGDRLVKWYGRIIITSSSGIVDNSEKDWLLELIEELEANPHPNFHVFRSDVPLNPRKSTEIVNAVEDVFGRLPSTRHYIAAEIGNRWTSKGEDVVTIADVKRCVDRDLVNLPTCSDPCVAFLDTSTTVEKTSLVIVADDIELSSYPWEMLYTPRIDFWWPKDFENGVIDDDIVKDRLSEVLQTYHKLKYVYVDTRGMPWAVAMCRDFKRKGGRGAFKVRQWTRKRDETDAGWNVLEHRIRERTIRIPHIKEIYDEFKGVMKQRDRSGNRPPRVIDRDRNRMHKDITEGLAMCCYFITDEKMKGEPLSLSNTIGKQSTSEIRQTLARLRSARGSTAWLTPNKL